MAHNAFQPSLDLFGPSSRPLPARKVSAGFSPWPREAREGEIGRAVAESVAAMLHLSEDLESAERLPRLLETALLASGSGPSGVTVLAQIDRALVNARGRDHGLLDGRYV